MSSLCLGHAKSSSMLDLGLTVILVQSTFCSSTDSSIGGADLAVNRLLSFLHLDGISTVIPCHPGTKLDGGTCRNALDWVKAEEGAQEARANSVRSLSAAQTALQPCQSMMHTRIRTGF